MTSLFSTITFRVKLTQVILSLASIIPVFCEVVVTRSFVTSEFVYLTLYSYLGIGIIVLVCLCIAQPVAEKVVLYSSIVATILHLLAAIFIIRDVFGDDLLGRWGQRLISGLCTGGNAVAFGWEVLYETKFILH